MTDPTPTLRALASAHDHGNCELCDALEKAHASLVQEMEKELVTLRAETAKYDVMLAEMETYLQHRLGCIARPEIQVSNGLGLQLPTCTCGLEALLRRSAAPGTTETET